MSEKYLTEAAWKSFSKGKGYKDDALLKALAAIARAEKGTAEDRLSALEALVGESTKLGKINPKDKDLASYVTEIAKSANREKVAAQKEQTELQAKKAKEVQAAKQAAEGDATDSPALLGSKLLAFLRSVRGKDDVRLNALVAIAGKQVGAVVDRSSIGGGHRMLLQKHLGVSGIKFIKGELCWEAKALTFVLETAAGGPLAAKLKLGLFEQTGQRLKIRVRAADSNDIEETEDESGHELAEGEAPAALDNTRFERVAALLKSAGAAGHPGTADAKALLVQAAQLQKRDPKGAEDMLKQAEALLARPVPPPTAGAMARPAAAAPGAAGPEAKRMLIQLAPLMDELSRPGQPLAADLVEPAGQAQRAFAMAAELVEQGNHERALVILKKLVEGGLLIRLRAARAAPTAAGGKPSVVEQRQFMLTRWKRVSVDLRAEVDALRKSVAQDAGDADPDGLAEGVSRYLDGLLERLQDRLDAAVNAGDSASLKGIRGEVEADPVMVHLASSPLGDGSRFRRAVVDAMDEIEASMTA